MVLEDISNFPLTWPATWPRTLNFRRKDAPFVKSSGLKHSVAEATDFVLNELRLLGARNPIISSNMQYRKDGLPYSKQAYLDDPGVAVYFILANQPRVLACDKWTKVMDNLWAIGKHIEAVRGQQRWGVGTIEQAFVGYEALPAPKTTWWEVLEVSGDVSFERAQTAYRILAKRYHPDAGGDHENFVRVQTAWEQAKEEKGW